MTASAQKLGSPMTGSELLDLYFPDVRSHLLEAAAALDRIEANANSDQVMADPRIQKLLAGLDILKSGGPDRAERFLRLFSEV